MVLMKTARYDKLIEAFGGTGHHVTDPQGLTKALTDALASGKPAIINCVIDPTAGTESGHISKSEPQEPDRRWTKVRGAVSMMLGDSGGVCATIATSTPNTAAPLLNNLSELLTRHVQEQPERTAVGTSDGGTVISYGQLDALVRSAMAQLSRLGLRHAATDRARLGQLC
jgi:hypothetical protein